MPFSVSRQTVVSSLLKRFPGMGEVIAWYGFDLSPQDEQDTVEKLAREYRVDPDELVVDLQTMVGEIEESEDNDFEVGDPKPGDSSGSQDPALLGDNDLDSNGDNGPGDQNGPVEES